MKSIITIFLFLSVFILSTPSSIIGRSIGRMAPAPPGVGVCPPNKKAPHWGTKNGSCLPSCGAAKSQFCKKHKKFCSNLTVASGSNCTRAAQQKRLAQSLTAYDVAQCCLVKSSIQQSRECRKAKDDIIKSENAIQTRWKNIKKHQYKFIDKIKGCSKGMACSAQFQNLITSLQAIHGIQIKYAALLKQSRDNGCKI